MTQTTIREAIDWIRECPVPGPQHELMTRVLTENESEFDNVSLQFTVSMYMQLNVIVGDGFHRVRGAEQEDQAWFTLGPHDGGLVLRQGIGFELRHEVCLSEDGARDLIRQGIEHVTGNV